MNILIKVLNEAAKIPQYAKEGDAAVDLIATSLTYTDGYVEMGTGLAIEIPEGYVGLLLPRSSISNTGLSFCNSLGTIDSGYRGELKVRFYNVSPGLKYKVGDKIAQLMILPYPKLTFTLSSDLSTTSRGNTGWGSSGN